jgi:hypothetical protein
MSAKTIFKSILTVFKMIRGAVALLFAIMWLFLFFWFTCGMLYVVALVLLEKFASTKVFDIAEGHFVIGNLGLIVLAIGLLVLRTIRQLKQMTPEELEEWHRRAAGPMPEPDFGSTYYLMGGLALINLHHSQ